MIIFQFFFLIDLTCKKQKTHPVMLNALVQEEFLNGK